MIFNPIAKINLGLNVTERREDGYHNIETVFFPIDISDKLEVEVKPVRDNHLELMLDGNEIEGNIEDNLIVKAHKLLSKDYDLLDCRCRLTKHIPTQAGLGGGSSDAAFMLKALNTLNNLQLTDIELESYAAKLGADCSFFIKCKPTFASGIGNDFYEVNITKELNDKWICLVKPPVAVSTKEAYNGILPKHPLRCCKEIVSLPLYKWKGLLSNDFEQTIFQKYPQVGAIKDRLYSMGAIYAQMSGSGSSVYGMFSEKPTHITDKIFRDCYVGISQIKLI